MKIEVSNLDLSTSKEDLIELFEDFGVVVRVQVLRPSLDSSRSKMAIVEMQHVADAMEAIADLQGEFYLGRHLQLQVVSNRQLLFESKMSDAIRQIEDDLEGDWTSNFEKIKKRDYNDYA